MTRRRAAPRLFDGTCRGRGCELITTITFHGASSLQGSAQGHSISSLLAPRRLTLTRLTEPLHTALSLAITDCLTVTTTLSHFRITDSFSVMDDDGDHAGEYDSQAYQSTSQWIKRQQAIDQPATEARVAAAESATDEPASPTSARSINNKNAKKLLLRQVKAYLCISRAQQQQPIDQLLSHHPTTALYIHGAGASCGVKYEECHALLSRHGSIVSLVTTGLLPFILVAYSSAAESTACRSSLHQTKHNGRLLYAEYANLAACTLMHDTSTLLLPNAVAGNVPAIPGLLLINDFLSEDDEQRILDFLMSQPWQPHKMRSVQHYGYAFDYERNDIHHNGQALTQKPADERKEEETTSDDQLHMFPAVFHPIIRRFQSLPSHPSIAPHNRHYSCDHPTLFLPDQLTVNRYMPGDGIPAHVDVHSSFTSYVVSISLCSPIVMDFMEAPLSANPPPPHPVVLPQRSMLVLSHEVRYGCHHAIQPRKTDRVDGRLVQREERISLTFRKRRESGVCHCEWTQLCDTASGVRKKGKKHVPAALKANGHGTTAQAVTSLSSSSSSSLSSSASSLPTLSSQSSSPESDSLSTQQAANGASLSALSSHTDALSSSVSPLTSTYSRITTLQQEMALLLSALEQRTRTQQTEWSASTQRWQQQVERVEAMQAELDRRLTVREGKGKGKRRKEKENAGRGWMRTTVGALIGTAAIGYGVYRLWQWSEEQRRRVIRR